MSGRHEPFSAVLDSSAMVAWFDPADEDQVDETRRILDGVARGEVMLDVLELALYEIGSVLERRRLPPSEIADDLDLIEELCGAPIVFVPWLRRDTAELARPNRLTFYDAAHLAVARALGVPLVTLDRALLAAGAITPAQFAGLLPA